MTISHAGVRACRSTILRRKSLSNGKFAAAALETTTAQPSHAIHPPGARTAGAGSASLAPSPPPGDGLTKHHGQRFSTHDVDHDRLTTQHGGSCARRFHGAWWYYSCYSSNLNGRYYRGGPGNSGPRGSHGGRVASEGGSGVGQGSRPGEISPSVGHGRPGESGTRGVPGGPPGGVGPRGVVGGRLGILEAGDEKPFDGVTWKPWHGSAYSLKRVEMKIRPRSATDVPPDP